MDIACNWACKQLLGWSLFLIIIALQIKTEPLNALSTFLLRKNT